MQSTEISWTDTHCHIYVPEFDDDREAMVNRALDAGVTRLMMPNIDEESINAMMALSALHTDHCFPMIGLHPCSVRPDFNEVLDRMELLLGKGNFYGIGETGIDLYWDVTYRQQQIEAFERQIAWAIKYQLPVIIHSRESLDVTIELIEKHQDGRLKGIFHCFSGSEEQVSRINALGFKVGIGGVLTYKKAGLDLLLPHIPLKMIVLETDSPYLAPVPYRGKRNEPAYLTAVAQRMSEILRIDLAALAQITNANADEVYGKMR